MKYGDKGNMTKAEIDKTIDFLIKTKKDGQFRAFWKTFDEIGQPDGLGRGRDPVDVVAGRRRRCAPRASPCVYQPLKEGYRAWGGGLRLAKHLQGAQLDAAYEYINWYLSGWVGAYPQPPGLLLGGARHRQGQHDARTNGASGWKASPPRATSRTRRAR